MRHIDESLRSTPTLVWLIREQGTRWLTASKRFVPALVPGGTRVIIGAQNRDDFRGAAASGCGTIVLWETDRRQLGDLIRRLTRHASWSSDAPASNGSGSDTVSVVASLELTAAERMALLELGVRAFVGRPEELPRLASLVRGVVARSAPAGSHPRRNP